MRAATRLRIWHCVAPGCDAMVERGARLCVTHRHAEDVAWAAAEAALRREADRLGALGDEAHDDAVDGSDDEVFEEEYDA